MDFPPLLKETLIREMRKKGESTENLKLDIVYRKKAVTNYKIAEEGEKPNVEVVCGLGTPVSPELYKGVVL